MAPTNQSVNYSLKFYLYCAKLQPKISWNALHNQKETNRKPPEQQGATAAWKKSYVEEKRAKFNSRGHSTALTFSLMLEGNTKQNLRGYPNT